MQMGKMSVTETGELISVHWIINFSTKQNECLPFKAEESVKLSGWQLKLPLTPLY